VPSALARAARTPADRAAHYLGDRSLSIGEVSYPLGFSEVAAFHRAFRRWYGCTPREFRASSGGRAAAG